MKPTNASGWELSDSKISLYLVNLIFDGEDRDTIEALNPTLNTYSGTTLGRLEVCAIDQEVAFALEINLLVTFLLVEIIVRVAWGSARRLSCPPLSWGKRVLVEGASQLGASKGWGKGVDLVAARCAWVDGTEKPYAAT